MTEAQFKDMCEIAEMGASDPFNNDEDFKGMMDMSGTTQLDGIEKGLREFEEKYNNGGEWRFLWRF